MAANPGLSGYVALGGVGAGERASIPQFQHPIAPATPTSALADVGR
jgi:hypothetical protein